MREAFGWSLGSNVVNSGGGPREAGTLASCGRHRRDNRRVRQRSGSGSGRATTATAAVMLCSLLGFSLQGVVRATESGADSMGVTAAAFVAEVGGSRTRSPQRYSSSSDPTATSKTCVARPFNTRRRLGHGVRGPVVSSVFTSVTGRSGRRMRRVHPSRLVKIQLAAVSTADKDTTSRSPRRIDATVDAAVDALPANDPSEPATAIGSSLLQPAPHSPPTVTSTTRLGYLKHCSVRALVMAGVASSAVSILDPPSAADAYPASTATQPSKEMIWLDEDSGTVSSRLSQVDETYGQGFVAYLARFLLNYDEGCREYFIGKLDVLVPKKDGSHVWEEFRGFVASVGLGLHKYEGSRGARLLCESLSRKYATPEHEGAAEQLAVLFTLLPPDVQPVAAVKSLLSFPTTRVPWLHSANSPKAASVDASSFMEKSPTELLPAAFRPLYDEATKAFYVPGIPQNLDGNSVELLFGSRGPYPTSKERGLTAVDFGLFAACGAIGCTSTHLSVVPLDVVKTRLQTNPGSYEGLAQGVVTIAREEGWPMLLQGVGPTLTGYLWYGVTVYPGYELFKRLFIDIMGPLNAALFRVPLVLAAGAMATSIACIGVCPAEAVRIRQVADPSVGGMLSATRQIVEESGWWKLYDGLPSILFRQISFGMMKFLVFDYFSEFAYGMMPFLSEKTSTQLLVSLASGLVAGVCAAIVSQPADTVLSILNRDAGRATIPSTLRSIVEQRGIGGLFLGLQSRIVWSGAIISGQFLLYDVCKTALHVSASDLRIFLDAISSAGL